MSSFEDYEEFNGEFPDYVPGSVFTREMFQLFDVIPEQRVTEWLMSAPDNMTGDSYVILFEKLEEDHVFL